MLSIDHVYGPSRPSKLALMGIRFLEGEGGAAPAAPAVPAAPAEPAATVTPPKPAPPASQDPEPIEGSTDGGKTFDAAYVEKLRKEAAKNRLDAKDEIQRQIDAALTAGQKAWATELGKKLGILEGDKDKTPDEIIAELKAERDQFKTDLDTLSARDIRRNESDAITEASDANDGDTALVKAWLKGNDLLKDIDPTADDYKAQVAAVVKAEIEKNTKLRKVQVAPRSGSEARPGGTPTPGPLSIEDRRKAIREQRAGK